MEIDTSAIESPATHTLYDLGNSHFDSSQRYGFTIGELNFIYDTAIACELIKSASLYPVPNTPAWMPGLINLRGSLVPIFNLEKYFDFPEEADNYQLILVLGKGDKAAGFQLKQYPQLISQLVKQDTLPKLIPKLQGYVLAAYRAEKTWLELDKDRFFANLGEKVCV